MHFSYIPLKKMSKWAWINKLKKKKKFAEAIKIELFFINFFFSQKNIFPSGFQSLLKKGPEVTGKEPKFFQDKLIVQIFTLIFIFFHSLPTDSNKDLNRTTKALSFFTV